MTVEHSRRYLSIWFEFLHNYITPSSQTTVSNNPFFLQANFSGEKWAVSGVKVTVMGALACAASYLIGFLIARYMLKDDAQTELCNV